MKKGITPPNDLRKKKFKKELCKDDFMFVDGFYYVGYVLDVDGNPWVDEEQIDEIIKELNRQNMEN